jgi:phosphohistidine swiveling domain-containing protein
MTATTRSPYAVDLGDERATDAALTGAKAASIARARCAGLPVIEGFAVTTAAHQFYLDAGRTLPASVVRDLRPVWAALTDDGSTALVVRSSSTVEDAGASSMAGQFRSVLDVRGWEAFTAAVTAVLDSADLVPGRSGPSPLAVLVQRYLRADRGGVMFGIDPVTGDPRHLVVEAVAGGPEALVSGRVTAQQYLLTRRGRVLAVDHTPAHLLDVRRRGSHLLRDHETRELARLAARTSATFGRPQDVEWAYDGEGRLLLLQSRPVTATGSAVEAVGPVLGPGPVAETFPDPLGPLETDLWIAPLRAGVADALRLTRAVPETHLEQSPVITTVGGRVAADLELFGYVRTRSHAVALDPRPALRRLTVSWAVGRIRATLDADARALCDEVDRWLSAIELAELDGADLLAVLDNAGGALQQLHRTEVLAGTLLPADPRTASGMALDVLVSARRATPDDDPELLRRHPVLLALVPPMMCAAVRLPPAPRTGVDAGPEPLGARELVRLRARWVHELTVRAAWRLGLVLTEADLLDDPRQVCLLDRVELRALMAGAPRPDLHERQQRLVAAAFAPPLPAQFRLTADGSVVPAAREGSRPGAGTGAGGGRGAGVVAHGSTRRPPAPGEVLVVRELAPGLAGWLPDLAGLVAETGGTLSHLAILAREYGVPTVVGVHDALRRFPVGCRVLVDGSTGEVVSLDHADAVQDEHEALGAPPARSSEEVGTS